MPADSTVNVTVTCVHHGASKTVSADFTANAAPEADDCDDPLGTLGGTAVQQTGTLSDTTGCRSLRRYQTRGSPNHYAQRHTFHMAAAGWVTISLDSTGLSHNSINPYLVLINGNSPTGGTALASDDDSGTGTNSRIARRFLQPGPYTIEATTSGPGGRGAYRLTIAVDYRTQITAGTARAELRVENGDTVTRSWTYKPTSAGLSVIVPTPSEGIDARVIADTGDATLTATPSKVGSYDVYVPHSNGGTTTSLHTRITSYCPTGQVELPSDCATPLDARDKGGDVIAVNQPHGHAPFPGCYETQLTESTRYLWCRRIVPTRTYILKSDPKILATGDRIVTSNGNFGRILMIEPDGWTEGDPLEALEGCQEITTEHWQCDFYSDQLFQTELEVGSLLQSKYVVPALRKGVLHPVGGLGVCGAMYLRAKYLPNPQTRAAAFGACGAAVVPPDSNSQIQQ